MSDSLPILAEIRLFPLGLPPRGWLWCDGQLIPMSQNLALFSLLGTYYGGDGRVSFALPDLRGSFPVGTGQSGALSARGLGEVGGEAQVSLSERQMPAHSHLLYGKSAPGTSNDPEGRILAMPSHGHAAESPSYGAAAAPGTVKLNPAALGQTGSDVPHNNMPPYLALHFAIAIQGEFPLRW